MLFVTPYYRDYKSLVSSTDPPAQPQVGLVMIGYMRVFNRVMTEANKAREKLDDAERSLNQAQRDLEQAQKELVDLFDPSRYGAQGEWKKLHDVCLKKDAGG
jgi:protein kinase C substrate 80K-H